MRFRRVLVKLISREITKHNVFINCEISILSFYDFVDHYNNTLNGKPIIIHGGSNYVLENQFIGELLILPTTSQGTSENITVKNVKCHGIVFFGGKNVLIQNVTIWNTTSALSGLFLDNSTIEELNSTKILFGILIGDSKDIIIRDSYVGESPNGIGIDRTSRADISNVTLYNVPQQSLGVNNATHVTISDLTIFGGPISIDGNRTVFETFSISSSTLNNREIKYFYDIADTTLVNENLGMLILGYSNNVSVTNSSIDYVYAKSITDLTIDNVEFFGPVDLPDIGYGGISIEIKDSVNVVLKQLNVNGSTIGIDLNNVTSFEILRSIINSTSRNSIYIEKSTMGLIDHNILLSYNMDNYSTVTIFLSDDITVVQNLVYSFREYCLVLLSSSDITVFGNTFTMVNDGKGGFDDSNNHWDNGKIGNAWLELPENTTYGVDNNGDLISDQAFLIDGGSQDRYPLMIPYGIKPIVLDIKYSPMTPTINDTITISAFVYDYRGIESVKLHLENTTTYILPMQKTDDYYSITISKQLVETITFKIEANSVFGLITTTSETRISISTTSGLPIVWDFYHVPTSPKENEDVTVYANVTSPIPEAPILEVILSYNNGTAWTNVSMASSEGNIYYAVIPKHPADVNITYKIYARNTVGWTESPEKSYTVSAIEQPSHGIEQYYVEIGLVARIAIVTVAGVYFYRKRK